MNKGMCVKKNTGSSLITVLAVTTVVMVVVLSVLAMAYRYYITETGSIYRQKGNEAARSMANEIRDELTKASFMSAAEFEQALSSGGIWAYVRKNVGQPDWPYYDSETFVRNTYQGETDPFPVNPADRTKADSIEAAKRSFKVKADYNGDADFKDEMPDMDVALYWEPGRYTDRFSDTLLYVEISCRMGDHITKLTQRYRLKTIAFAEGNGSMETLNGMYKYQNWIWSYDGEM